MSARAEGRGPPRAARTRDTTSGFALLRMYARRPAEPEVSGNGDAWDKEGGEMHEEGPCTRRGGAEGGKVGIS